MEVALSLESGFKTNIRENFRYGKRHHEIFELHDKFFNIFRKIIFKKQFFLF